jgi:putative ABC transport system substrate-binding protein
MDLDMGRSSRRSRCRHVPIYRVVLLLLLVAVFASGCSGPKKVYKVGILCGLEYVAVIADSFLAKMSELGYVEGENIYYLQRRMDFDLEEYRRVLREFVANKVDAILVFPTEASMEAKEITAGTGTSVVFAFSNIEGTGLVKSIREPGGNITGVRYPGPDIAVKRLELVMELVPGVKRILIPYQRDYPIVFHQMEMIAPVAKKAGITLLEAPAANAEEIEAILAGYEKDGDPPFDAIMFVAEPLTVTPEPFVALTRFAQKHKILIGGALMTVDEYSSVFGVNADLVTTGEQAAFLVDKILHGTPAGSIPVISSDITLEFNVKAAQEFGVKISPELLRMAQVVVR